MKKHIQLTPLAIAASTFVGMLGMTFTPVLVSAQASKSNVPQYSASGSSASGSTNKPGNTPTPSDKAKLKAVIKDGDSQISRRQKDLIKLKTEVSKSSSLTAAHKSALTTQINSEVIGLQMVKNKLDADTDLKTAKTDAGNVVTAFRVYVLITPKVRHLEAADAQVASELKIGVMSGAIKSYLDAAASTGKNVDALNKKLADLNAQLTKAASLTSAAETSLPGLTPASYNADHNVVKTASMQLKGAQNDIKAAMKDAKDILKG